MRSNGWPATSPSFASIWAALASASCSCAAVSDGEMRTSSAPCVHARAALDGRLDHPAGGFGADFRLRVGHERARHAEIAIDRAALDRQRSRWRAVRQPCRRPARFRAAVEQPPARSEAGEDKGNARNEKIETPTCHTSLTQLHRTMTLCSSRGTEGRGEPGAQTRQRRFERVAGEGVRVFSRRHPSAQPRDRGARGRGDENAEDRVRRGSPAGKSPASIARWIPAPSCAFPSRTNSNRSQFWLICGTVRSRNIRAKYSGCDLLNS